MRVVISPFISLISLARSFTESSREATLFIVILFHDKAVSSLASWVRHLSNKVAYSRCTTSTPLFATRSKVASLLSNFFSRNISISFLSVAHHSWVR